MVFEALFVFDMLLVIVAVVVVITVEIYFHVEGWEWIAAIDRRCGGNNVVAGGRGVMVVVAAIASI